MTVHLQRSAGVVTLTLDRPRQRNAITDQMWQQLGELLAQVRVETGDRVVVLTGAGGSFSAGSDITSFGDCDPPLADRIRVCNHTLIRLYELGVPTVAVVDGIAAGSGANLALLCDFVLASTRSGFAELFTRIGLSLDTGASWLLPRLVGDRRARQLALLGDTLDAPTAAAWGLITQAVPLEQLEQTRDALVQRLAATSPVATAGSKRLLAAGQQTSLAEALEAETVNQLRVIATEPAQAAIAAFLAGARARKDS